MSVSPKYENTILYLCKALGGTIRGKKKLAKLLYYVDFDRYEYKESMQSVTGTTYIKKPMGPVPVDLDSAIDSLSSKGVIRTRSVDEYGNGYRPTECFEALAEPNTSVFDGDDVFILNEVIGRYGKLTGKQLEDLTHSEAPYLGTPDNDIVEYGLTFYRGTDFSHALC